MLARIFPRQFGNEYDGHWIAIVLLWAITVFKTIMAYNTAINTRYGAIHADGIPVDSYPPDAAVQVLSIFAKLGNLHFILVALSLMALIRYRSMVPLIYLILICEYIARRLQTTIWEDAPFLQLAHSTGGAIVQSLFLAMVIGFVLSLWSRGASSDRTS